MYQAHLSQIKSYNYYNLNLKSQANKENFKALHLLKNNDDEESNSLRSSIYNTLASTYLNDKKTDSAFYYFKIQEKKLKQQPEKENFFIISDYYLFLGATFLEAKKADSALYYFKKSSQIKQKYNDTVLFKQYSFFGDYYTQQKDYKKALKFHLKTIEGLKNSSQPLVLAECYTKISDIYAVLGEKTKQVEYKNRALKIEKEALIKQNKNADYAVNVILKDQATENTKTLRGKYIWISCGILLLIIIFFIIYSLLQKKIKNQEIVINEASNTLQQKEELISQKHIETEELQLKINDACTEVIDLAKNNDPSFYFRFQEVYPEFQKKLLEINPSLRTSELILCAYTFLGFSIKDVADHTFKSVNTIRNRKQSLRKKFDIPSEQNMASWLRNLIEKEN